jgi:hypothetical protein
MCPVSSDLNLKAIKRKKKAAIRGGKEPKKKEQKRV